MTASTTAQLLSVKWSNTQHCISVSLLNLDCKRTFNTNRSLKISASSLITIQTLFRSY